MRGRKTTQTEVEQGRGRDRVRAEIQKWLYGGVFLETECRSVWLKLLKKHPWLRTGNGKLLNCLSVSSPSAKACCEPDWHSDTVVLAGTAGPHVNAIHALVTCPVIWQVAPLDVDDNKRSCSSDSFFFFCLLKCYKAVWKLIRGKGLNEQKILYLQQGQLSGL